MFISQFELPLYFGLYSAHDFAKKILRFPGGHAIIHAITHLCPAGVCAARAVAAREGPEGGKTRRKPKWQSFP